MMRYSIARRTSDGTIAAAALEIIAGLKDCSVVSVEVSLVAATATVLGLGRPAAKGISPTTPVSVLCDQGGVVSASSSGIATAIAWGTGPTVPAQFFRRVSLPATIGAAFAWTFGQGLWIPTGGTLVLWNISAASVLDVTVVVEE